MQSQVYDEFKRILHYQDHLTKFCYLRALKMKQALGVARALVDIFCIQGAPLLLQSDNGKEFVAQVITQLEVLWPGLKLLQGRPRHPQSQGSVERANQDIEPMIGQWLHDNNTRNWPLGLNFVQLAKNTIIHSGIGSAPM